MADCLAEPWRTHFTSLKDEYDGALRALPPSDQVPAAMEAHQHLSAFYSCLANASSLASMLVTQLHTMSQKEGERVAAALCCAVDAKLQDGLRTASCSRKCRWVSLRFLSLCVLQNSALNSPCCRIHLRSRDHRNGQRS
jgi:hypothetical protein